MENRRRILENRAQRIKKRKELQENVGKVLGINSRWWGDVDTEFMFNDAEEDDDEDLDKNDIYVRSNVLCNAFVANARPLDASARLHIYARLCTARSAGHL